MSWWLKNNLRMIQNNLRDVDAMMDIDSHIEWLKSLHANVLQIGCGGITAFHPSALAYQYRNPFMKGDFIGEVVEKCHAAHIRVIARFDFSKTHESFYEAHPEWYSRTMNGSPVRYHDTVATCVNGEYQRELSLHIIEEVLRKYPVDGIFFNAFGYLTTDYSGNYIGICQCDGCRQQFKERYGEELPVKEDLQDPVFIKYLEFKKTTVNEMLEKIHQLTRSISPDIAVSTYATHGVDIVRNESNSAVDRPLPFWIYNSTDNVGLIEDGYDDKISSNCVINAVDLPYRFMGVSRYLNQIRLYGNLAAGSGLDWCIIGNFDDYPDHKNVDGTRKVFAFHEKYEAYYGHFDHAAKVMLIHAGDRKHRNQEYRGLFQMLKEEHIQFTIVDIEALERKAEEMDAYDFILLPDVPGVSRHVMECLQKTTACVIACGGTLEETPEDVKTLFGVCLGAGIDDVRGTYMRTEPKSVFRDFPNQEWVYLDQPYHAITLEEGVQGLLPKVEKTMFGPPERCYGHQDSADFMAAVKGDRCLYLPWNIGALYNQQGYSEFKRLFFDLMNSLRPVPRAFQTDAPEMVEMYLNRCDEHTFMLQLINMTGFNGTTFFEPLEIPDIHVTFSQLIPAAAEEMTEEGLKPVPYDNGLKITIPKGTVYQSYLLRI